MVLGGGIVAGSVNLIAGQPGIGKSTLLLQLAYEMSKKQSVLYVSAEESAHQVGLRAERPADLQEAVARGLRLARPGDTLLLSPALPGFFHLHYLSSGREEGFRAVLRRLTAGRGPERPATAPGG